MTATTTPAPGATQAAECTETSLAIGGMTCASCVRRVEKALTRVEGVVAASVNLANLHHEQGRFEKADEELENGTRIQEALLKEHPRSEEFQWRYSQCLNNKAAWQIERGNRAEAIALLEKALAVE